MLEIVIPDSELWDEKKEEFITVKGGTLQLEHSLLSISKWESKWHKPYLSTDKKTEEETLDYIKCMTLNKNANSDLYNYLTNKQYTQIYKYINDPMTAVKFYEEGKKGGRKEIITSELIYYWMISFNIPVEFQKWHVNRLLTLIRMCEIRNKPPKKMNKSEIMKRNARLNAERRKKYNTKG